MQPTDVLMAEHRLIEQVLNCLEKIVQRAETEKKLERESALEAIDFCRLFVDGFHHVKEEAYLFPAMEAKGFSGGCSPVVVMQREHELGGMYVQGMATTLESAALGEPESLKWFVQHGKNYVKLLREHIRKEDTCLFPTANHRLTDATQHELLDAFQNVESGEIATPTAGMRDKYVALANRLADRLGVPRADAQPTQQGESGCVYCDTKPPLEQNDAAGQGACGCESCAANAFEGETSSQEQVSLDGTTTVRELVGRHPRTRAVFEQYGIDYCCGGGKCLAEAAAASHIKLSDLIAALQTALNAPPDASGTAERDWYHAPLRELVDHIVRVHHAYVKRAFPRIRELLRKVLNAHGATHGAMLREVHEQCTKLDDEFGSHLAEEETILFPYIVAAEANRQNGAPPPDGCFGSAGTLIGQMKDEHVAAGQALHRIREVTDGYRLPEDACATFRALYEELQYFEKDLHQHIHLENNILFPRAVEAESAQSGGMAKTKS